jgi:hypothetical protein
VLDRLYDRLSLGGFVVIDGFADAERRAAVEAVRARRGITEPIEAIGHGTVAWRKTAKAEAPTPDEPAEPADANEVADRPTGPILAPPRGWIPTDLTVWWSSTT